MPDEIGNDKTYSVASARALGRFLAEVMAGMIEGGMAHAEAFEAVKVYMIAMVQRPPDPPTEAKPDA